MREFKVGDKVQFFGPKCHQSSFWTEGKCVIVSSISYDEFLDCKTDDGHSCNHYKKYFKLAEVSKVMPLERLPKWF